MTAVKTIILADVVMSLDNILAVGGAAHGHQGLLIFGLALSIPLLLLGSALIARLMGRLPALVYVGVVILVFTAVRMFFEDDFVREIYHAELPVILIVSARDLFGGDLQRNEGHETGSRFGDPDYDRNRLETNFDFRINPKIHVRRRLIREHRMHMTCSLPSPVERRTRSTLPFPALARLLAGPMFCPRCNHHPE